MSLASEIVERIFFPNRDPHAIPVLDGGFSPNNRLDEAAVVAEVPTPEALAVSGDGDVLVSSGQEILRFRQADFSRPEPFTTLEATVGALACGDGLLYAAVAGIGVVALDAAGREVGRLTAVDGEDLHCITAIAVGREGELLLTDGSRHNGPAAWLRDMMEKRPGSGRLISCGMDLGGAVMLRDGLRWPAGVAVDGEEILVSEAWSHRLLAVSRSDGAMTVKVKNFAGYPARIQPSAAGGYWIAFFALRTQLTEFVLREDRFRTRMMAEIEPKLWIGPSLGDHFDYREPTQVGRIKKLGIQKPWAPPRSYGLIARVDEDGVAIESLHSRVSGKTHGITDLAEVDGRLLAVSKGHSTVVAVPLRTADAASGKEGA